MCRWKPLLAPRLGGTAVVPLALSQTVMDGAAVKAAATKTISSGTLPPTTVTGLHKPQRNATPRAGTGILRIAVVAVVRRLAIATVDLIGVTMFRRAVIPA